MIGCSICHTPIDTSGQYLDVVVHNFGSTKTLHLCSNPRCVMLYVESAGFVQGRRGINA